MICRFCGGAVKIIGSVTSPRGFECIDCGQRNTQVHEHEYKPGEQEPEDDILITGCYHNWRYNPYSDTMECVACGEKAAPDSSCDEIPMPERDATACPHTKFAFKYLGAECLLCGEVFHREPYDKE